VPARHGANSHQQARVHHQTSHWLFFTWEVQASCKQPSQGSTHQPKQVAAAGHFSQGAGSPVFQRQLAEAKQALCPAWAGGVRLAVLAPGGGGANKQSNEHISTKLAACFNCSSPSNLPLTACTSSQHHRAQWLDSQLRSQGCFRWSFEAPQQKNNNKRPDTQSRERFTLV